jgi:hypothetical protein
MLKMLPDKLYNIRRKRSMGHMVQKKKKAFICIYFSSNSTSWTCLLISFEFIVFIRPISFVATPTYTCQQFPTFSLSGMYGIHKNRSCIWSTFNALAIISHVNYKETRTYPFPVFQILCQFQWCEMHLLLCNLAQLEGVIHQNHYEEGGKTIGCVHKHG